MKTNLAELTVGDEVTVLPDGSTNPADAIKVVPLSHVGSVYLELADGWLYSMIGGSGLNGSKGTHIIPAMDDRRAPGHAVQAH